MPDVSHALPVGTRLAEFEIVGIVGEGGFGIVYLAQDHLLERQVALKEFMPSTLARRGEGIGVEVRSPRMRDTFDAALRSFVNEARMLAQFDHPALVKVFRFWEANGTAYMVMPYYRGPTLRDALRGPGGTPSEPWLRELLVPLLDALEQLHAQNCFHRDIAPDNILILDDGRPLLLDFGAARRVIGDVTQDLTVILKPGFAPIEQYVNGPEMRQGPWTDVYALAAVVHYCVTGRTPPPSVSRMMTDTLEPLAPGGPSALSAPFCAAVGHALAVKIEDRTASMAAFRRDLGIAGVSPTRLGAAPSAAAVAQGGAAPPPVSGIPGDPFGPTEMPSTPSGPPARSGGSIPDDWDRTVAVPRGHVPAAPVPPRVDASTPSASGSGWAGGPGLGNALFRGLDNAGNVGGPQIAPPPSPTPVADEGRQRVIPPPSAPIDRGQGGRWGAAIGGALAVVAIVVGSAWWFGGGASKGGRGDATVVRAARDDGDTKPPDAQGADPARARADDQQSAVPGLQAMRPDDPRVGLDRDGGSGSLPAQNPPNLEPPIRPVYSPDVVIDALAAAGDPAWQVDVRLDRDTVRIGKDRLRFSITSARAGYVYVLMAGTDKSHFHLLFPNSIDRNNRIGTDKPLSLPRQNWEMIADGPEGADRLVAIVSAVPRDFTGAGLRTVEPFAEFERTVAEGVFSSQGPMPFAGTAPGCPPADGACARFGARAFEIREVR